MKIAVIGSACTGKSTYIQDFLNKWDTYKLCEKPRYTDNVKGDNLVLNENGTEESQRKILNSLIDQVIDTNKDEDTVFDRSVLDNLVYTMWLKANNKVSDGFVKETIKLVRETLPLYDILFFLPITKTSPINFAPSENRSASKIYRREIDNIFKALVNQYYQSDNTYFPFDNDKGCPAIIEIFGNPEERIELTKLYLDTNGQPYGEEDSLIQLSEDDLKIEKDIEASISPIITKNKDIIMP